MGRESDRLLEGKRRGDGGSQGISQLRSLHFIPHLASHTSEAGMAGMAGEGASGSSSPQRAAPSPPLVSLRSSRPDPLLVVCRCFSFITAIVAFACVLANALSAVHSFRGDHPDIFSGIFRCYAVVIAIFVAVAETEWSLVFKFWKILEYWVGRGMLQIFVSVMTRAFPDIHGEENNLILLQEISSYMLLTCGLIYTICGFLCIGFLKRARQKKEISREQAIRDLEELARRREELESLLITENV